jgi:hypothetical protein
MNSPSKKQSLPAVAGAGIVAIIFGVFGVLGSLLGGLSLLLMPQIQTPQRTPPMPEGLRAMSAAMMFFLLALAVFGIFVGAGVIRRRNWARVTILVWTGFMTFVSVGAIAFSLLIFSAVQTQLPNVNPADADKVMQFMRIFLVIFYGIPAGVGIWWIVLFTRKRVATAFTSPAASLAEYALSMDPSGFPQSESAIEPQRKLRPTCPLPLAIFSVFLIFSSVCMLLFLLFPMPASFPLFFFGHVFVGAAPKIFLAFIGAVSGVAGFGMLRLKPWALYTELVIQFVFLVNAVVTFLSPSYGPIMRAAMQEFMEQYPASPVGNSLLTDNYFRGGVIFGLVLCAAFATLLLSQRPRFLEAAAEAAKA